MTDNCIHDSVLFSLNNMLGSGDISLKDNLKNDLQMDSLMLVLVITDVCSSNGIDIFKIDEKEIANLVTVNDLSVLIDNANSL